MSRLKIFDSIIDKARDWWRGVMYRIGTGVGESKHRSILDYKSDLNDPDYWNSIPNFGPEDGGEQVYGTRKTGQFARKGEPDVLHGVTAAEVFQQTLVAKTGVYSKVKAGDEADLRILRKNVFGDVIGSREDAAKYVSNYRNADRNHPTDPLVVPGISAVPEGHTVSLMPTALKQVSGSVAGLRNKEGNGTTETFNYVKNTTVVPSWIQESRENPSRNKSKAGLQRDLEKVTLISRWPEGEPTDPYLKENTNVESYSFAKNFQIEKEAKFYKKEVGSGTEIRNKNLKLSKDSEIPGDKIATIFYKRAALSSSNVVPGGQQVDSTLKYDPIYEETLGLIPFCITTLTPNHRTYLNFPAHLESYSDSYNGNWDSTQYVGRAENFYGYTGFKRNISISFKIAILRKEDATEMYHRLNRLVGATAPSYDSTGLFMRGTLASLTIGDLLRHKDGFIENVSIKWQQDYPWETVPSSKPEIYRVPHVLDVDLQFVPIEDKTVTENNGDYFVFISKTPEPKEEKTAPPAEIKKQEAPPSTRMELTLPKVESVTPPQIDKLVNAQLRNVKGGAGGRGNSAVFPYRENEQFTLLPGSEEIVNSIIRKPL